MTECESALWCCRTGRDTKRVIDGHRVPLYVNPHKCVTTRGNGDRHAIKMTSAIATFGQSIAKARKEKALSQKDLAGRIMKEEDGRAISPQYLNDIEHDRRSPTSDHLIRQFAVVLDMDENTLFVLAGKIPDDVRRDLTDPAKAGAAFMNFRKSITKK